MLRKKKLRKVKSKSLKSEIWKKFVRERERWITAGAIP